MNMIDSAGVYVGTIVESGVNTTKNGFPQWSARLQAAKKWIDMELNENRTAKARGAVKAGMGRHETTKQPGDPTYSKEWSGVTNAPHAEGKHCPRCSEQLHKEGDSHYCPKCDDYVVPTEGR